MIGSTTLGDLLKMTSGNSVMARFLRMKYSPLNFADFIVNL